MYKNPLKTRVISVIIIMEEGENGMAINIGINHLYNLGNFSPVNTEASGDGEFAAALESFLPGNVIISPKIENQLTGDTETAREIREKISQAMKELGSDRDSVIIVNRQGEISRYSLKKENDKTQLTAEELKAVAKARARKKARLDAYFHLLERVSIKRKLIEQENAKASNKKYRCSVTRLDIIARNRQITSPPLNPEYYF